MNERMIGNRPQTLLPVILRLGIAAALALHGFRQFTPPGADDRTGNSAVGEHAIPAAADIGSPLAVVPVTPDSPGDPQGLSVTPAGLVLGTPWNTVVGGAEIGAAAFLILGILTRLTALGLLGAAGYAGLMPHFGPVEGVLARFGDILPQAGEPTLLLLAVLSLALLMSGCGALGLDKRLFNRNRPATDLTTP